MERKYTLVKRKGIDDLEGILGDFQTEFWTAQDWADWTAEENGRKRRNEEYIKKLKERGEYGQEYEVNLTVAENPLFEDKNAPASESFRLVILDTKDLVDKSRKGT